MKRRVVCGILLFAGLIPLIAQGRRSGEGEVEYQSPLPGARLVLPQTTIIVRPGGAMSRQALATPGVFDVAGSFSGAHPGEAVLSDDQRTIVFKPLHPFASGERVTVHVSRSLPAADGRVIAPWQFTFTIADRRPPGLPVRERIFGEVFGSYQETNALSLPPVAGAAESTHRTDTLPLDFPSITATLYGTPAPGRLFLGNVRFSGSFTPYLMIVDDSGNPLFYRKMEGWCTDFTMQPGGEATYFDTFRGRFYELDASLAVVDSFFCGNGYSTDLHELRILPNGHALLLGDDPEEVDMSQDVPGGDPHAIVTGLILQELDLAKNVVLEWRSWDHFQITDATHEDLTAPKIDYVHGNAIELDEDGNVLLSSRHMDEITKIDRVTGNIIWRWGGKHNEFTLVNDSLGFSHQHAIRRLENGDITMFDNGNFHTPPFSRAVEYRLDEAGRTATLVWQFRNAPDVYGPAMGYVQRLSGGNTLIGWGATSPAVTEVAPDGSKVFELSFDGGVFSYRAYRFEWRPESVATPRTIPASVSLSQNFPNPFNGTTNIILGIPAATSITFKILNVLGQEVETVLNEVYRPPGQYTVALNLGSLPSGIYFYRLSTGSASITRRMALVR